MLYYAKRRIYNVPNSIKLLLHLSGSPNLKNRWDKSDIHCIVCFNSSRNFLITESIKRIYIKYNNKKTLRQLINGLKTCVIVQVCFRWLIFPPMPNFRSKLINYMYVLRYEVCAYSSADVNIKITWPWKYFEVRELFGNSYFLERKTKINKSRMRDGCNRAVFPAVRKSEIYVSKIITKTHYIA